MNTDLIKFIKKHKIIGLDSMIFIYHFEESSGFCGKTIEIFESMERGKFKAISSVITLIEILTHPKKQKDFYLVKEYQELLANFPNLEIKDVDVKISDLASSLRAEYNLTTPDAIVVATALLNKATGFITSDKIFSRIKELEIFVLKND